MINKQDTSAYFEQERREKNRLILKLEISLDSERVEDGITHPAEKIVDDALNSPKKRVVYTWLSELAVDVECPDMAASVLRCLGRRKSEPLAWRVEVVKAALAVADVEIRDAAVQASEFWGEWELCNVLERHSEVVPWLRNYIEDVIKYLREAT